MYIYYIYVYIMYIYIYYYMHSEEYPEPCPTSKMEFFEKIVNIFHLLTISKKAPS